MISIKENSLIHFDLVKNYFSDVINVRRVSTTNCKIAEEEIDKIIAEFINGRPNIYALLIKKPEDQQWSLKYVGQRESQGIKQRLREHLIKCHSKTGSQLNRINEALQNGYEIGIKLAAILPDSKGKEHFRLVYESMLIEEFREKLEWNMQK